MKDCLRQCGDIKIIFVIKCRHSDLKGNAIYIKPPLLFTLARVRQAPVSDHFKMVSTSAYNLYLPE